MTHKTYGWYTNREAFSNTNGLLFDDTFKAGGKDSIMLQLRWSNMDISIYE